LMCYLNDNYSLKKCIIFLLCHDSDPCM